ncbi:LysR family transcriptional regulator [Geosporobacter ferrireducens]|uniref:LysR family transcriptional regulator n=1 Tax=Geosporobacter ferrireducens TaxID=1424294 RepID=UPI00139D9356|nr:LysR family transcriptional regulator [Geosporobacter ferrireducens]MTI56607.1 LysR family transcriptional regulator [Geosporobacter ferrireducens]
MLNNYKYFIQLAEDLNITQAATNLFISHQNLSKYLKKLESTYDVKLFTRKPKFELTYAGQILLENFKRIEVIESNLHSKMAGLKDGKTGEIRIGTTEGRLRLFMPDLIHKFKEIYPNVELRIVGTKTQELIQMIENNKIDLAIIGGYENVMPNFHYDVILSERLYLIISDSMLEKYFPETYQEDKETFKSGVDLRLFSGVPFVLNYPGFSSRSVIDRHLLKLGITLNCIDEVSAMDLHHLITAKGYAASFGWTMYLPDIWRHNSSSTASKLNIFPITGLQETHPIAITYIKDRVFPDYTYTAINIIKKLCEYYHNLDL